MQLSEYPKKVAVLILKNVLFFFNLMEGLM